MVDNFDTSGSVDRSFDIGRGWDVIGIDGNKVGTVAAVEAHHIKVEKGFLFKEDHDIPTSAIADVRDEVVVINLTSDQITNEEWRREPVAGREFDDQSRLAGQAHAGTAGEHVAGTSDAAHIELAEERLDVDTHDVNRGSAHIHKDVIEEEKSVDVPLREERIRVERHAVNEPLDELPGDAFQEQDIEIPIRGEEADVTRRARVREEVDVYKDVEERHEQVSDTVRREELRVDEDDTPRRNRP